MAQWRSRAAIRDNKIITLTSARTKLEKQPYSGYTETAP